MNGGNRRRSKISQQTLTVFKLRARRSHAILMEPSARGRRCRQASLTVLPTRKNQETCEAGGVIHTHDGCCSRSNGFAVTILHSQAGDLRGNCVSGICGVAGAGTAPGSRASHASRRDDTREFRLAACFNGNVVTAARRDAGAALQLAPASGKGHGEVGAFAAFGMILG